MFVIEKNRATALSDLRHLSTGCLDPSPTRRAGLRALKSMDERWATI